MAAYAVREHDVVKELSARAALNGGSEEMLKNYRKAAGKLAELAERVKWKV